MLKEDYIISIIGKQKYEDEDGDFEVSVNTYGSYASRNGSRYITYKEYEEGNSAPSGTSVLKIEDNKRVTLLKSGSATRLILEKGKRHNCVYATDFGQMMVGTYTTELENTLDDNGGELNINYTMDVNSSLTSENHIHVTVKPAEI